MQRDPKILLFYVTFSRGKFAKVLADPVKTSDKIGNDEQD